MTLPLWNSIWCYYGDSSKKVFVSFKYRDMMAFSLKWKYEKEQTEQKPGI